MFVNIQNHKVHFNMFISVILAGFCTISIIKMIFADEKSPFLITSILLIMILCTLTPIMIIIIDNT